MSSFNYKVGLGFWQSLRCRELCLSFSTLTFEVWDSESCRRWETNPGETYSETPKWVTMSSRLKITMTAWQKWHDWSHLCVDLHVTWMSFPQNKATLIFYRRQQLLSLFHKCHQKHTLMQERKSYDNVIEKVFYFIFYIHAGTLQ